MVGPISHPGVTCADVLTTSSDALAAGSPTAAQQHAGLSVEHCMPHLYAHLVNRKRRGASALVTRATSACTPGVFFPSFIRPQAAIWSTTKLWSTSTLLCDIYVPDFRLLAEAEPRRSPWVTVPTAAGPRSCFFDLRIGAHTSQAQVGCAQGGHSAG